MSSTKLRATISPPSAFGVGSPFAWRACRFEGVADQLPRGLPDAREARGDAGRVGQSHEGLLRFAHRGSFGDIEARIESGARARRYCPAVLRRTPRSNAESGSLIAR